MSQNVLSLDTRRRPLSFLDLPYELRCMVYDNFFDFDKPTNTSHLFRLNKQIYQEAHDLMLKANVFVLVSFNWPSGCYSRIFVSTLALSCDYDLGQKNRLQNGLVMSTDLYHSSAYAFPHYDLRLSTYVNGSNGTFDVMVIGMDNLHALLHTISAYDIPLWHDGPRVRQLLYRFQHKDYPGYLPVNGTPWTLIDEHPRVLAITQCFRDHWWDFDNIRIVRVSNAMQGKRVYLENRHGSSAVDITKILDHWWNYDNIRIVRVSNAVQSNRVYLENKHESSAVDITKILKKGYNKGLTCWQHLTTKAAERRILKVKNTIRSTFATLSQRQKPSIESSRLASLS